MTLSIIFMAASVVMVMYGLVCMGFTLHGLRYKWLNLGFFLLTTCYVVYGSIIYLKDL